jgi:UDP-N-acetylglucosamine diphosphorylase/glucosamine-1-phosphate N-acetyltransferase
MVVLDTTMGDIVIDEESVIEPFVVLQGPCHIGAHCTIAAHAHIRPFTVMGEHCKIGGEINACVFHGHANKAHLGFLGNSIVGRWANLGAGTTTSNLKNTYGQVAMQRLADAATQPTGMTFLGSIIGDHVKTAIGTRLTTGSCIGTGAMIACSSFAPKFLDRFSFVTDRGMAYYDFQKFCEVARRVMGRRDMTLTQAESDRLAQLYSTIRV